MTASVSSRRDGVQYLYLLAAFVVVVAGMRAAESILNPFLLAIFVAVICAPFYFALLRRGMPQGIAILTVGAGLVLLTAGLFRIVMGSITDFTSQQNSYQMKIAEKQELYLHRFQRWMKADDQKVPISDDPTATPQQNGSVGHNTVPDGIDDRTDGDDSTESAAAAAPDDAPDRGLSVLIDQLTPAGILTLVAQLAGSLAGLASQTVLIALTVVFILLEAGTFPEKLRRAFPQDADTSEQASRMVHSLQRYIAIKTLMSLATAVLIGIWLRLLGQVFDIRFIGLWVLFVFLLNFIPNVGSFAAAIPPILIAWLDTPVTPETTLIDEFLPASSVAVGYLVINVVIGNIVEPRFMGRSLGLSPLVVFCSMVFWGWVLGPVGMLLSVPLTMSVHIVLNGFDDTRWISTLMGGIPADADASAAD